MKKPTDAIIVFAKYPEEGSVKTRLAKTTGNKFAAKFYKLCAEHTFGELKKFSQQRHKVYVFYSLEKDKQRIQSWINFDFSYFYQTGEELGEKMFNAFGKVFEDEIEKAVIIGTDLPDISSEIIRLALTSLEKYDAVIGPSNDGGYYLLGIKQLTKKLFEGIKWSSGSVFSKTIEILNGQNQEVKILPELIDIDTETDLVNWLNNKSDNDSGLRTLIKDIYTS